MFVDARGIPSNTILTTDLCILGAGAAGIALAREFIGQRRRVCLIESGGFEVDRQSQSLAAGSSLGQAYSELDTCQIRCFGGTTNAWGGWFRPFDEIDFRQRDWVEDSGWPFPRADLAPYYRAAHEICQIERDDYDLEAALRELAAPAMAALPLDPSALETVLYRFSPPTRFGQAYRAALDTAPNVDCLMRATGLRLETTANAGTVTRLQLGSLAGNRFEVASKIFVLAAGTIENARLLLLSNDIASAGLGNQHDVVGRYFMDHPHLQRGLTLDRSPRALALYDPSSRGRGLVARIALSTAIQQREGLLNYGANIYPAQGVGWRALRDFAATLLQHRGDPYRRSVLPFVRRRASPRQVATIARHLDHVAAGVFRHLVPGRHWVLESKPEQAPNRSSRLVLARERDALGRRRIAVDWRLSPLDRRTVQRAEQVIDDELRRLGLGRLAPLSPAEQENRLANLVGGWHQMGTTRMHDDPKRGVVDRNGKVHGVSNLFIAGGSVFATGGAASPTPTILALTLRLADHVKPLLAAL